MPEQKKLYDIAIIGGGASGLFAAVCAVREMKKRGRRDSVILLEKNDRVGKKLLMTGNGRCNLTNLSADRVKYGGRNPVVAQKVIAMCPPAKTLRIFHELGVECFEGAEGRVYPRSEQAASVLDMLRYRLEQEGVEQRCDFRVKELRKNGGRFLLGNGEESVLARRVIFAAGGASARADAESYALCEKLGHGRNPIFPSLVQIKTDPNVVKSMKGMKCSARVTVTADRKTIGSEQGEVLFTEYGLSGICIFQISRAVSEYFTCGTIYGRRSGRPEIVLDLLPEKSGEETLALLQERRENLKGYPMEYFLDGLLNKKIGQEVLKSVVSEPFKRKVGSMTDTEWKALAETIKNWKFLPTGTMSWQQAQVTAGGLKTEEFSMRTLESLKVKGLFACGEVLDVDGICGGFNLQWAWSSGYLAGQSAVASLEEKPEGRKGRT